MSCIEKFTRQIVKNGRNSYYINIPKELMQEMRLREHQKLTLTQSGSKIVIADWKK